MPSGPSDGNKRDPPVTALIIGIYACFFVEGHAICETEPRSLPGDLGVAPAVAHILRRCVADTLPHLAAPILAPLERQGKRRASQLFVCIPHIGHAAGWLGL